MKIKVLLVLLTIVYLVYPLFAQPQPVQKLDVQGYLGRWYQVMGDSFNLLFSKNGTCATADYSSPIGDSSEGYSLSLSNKSRISIFNNQFVNGLSNNISGYAEQISKQFEGMLSVYLEGVPNAGQYYIYYLGPLVNGTYISSIVSDGFFLSLYVLVRNVDYYYKYLQTELLDIVQKYGFTNYYPVNHLNCNYPIPPCYH